MGGSSADKGTKALAASTRAVTVRQFRIRVAAGPDAGAAQTADTDELSVGTAHGNTLVVTDESVSRAHFAITATARGFELRDLGSTNGTFVSDLRVARAYLDRNATIRAGETELQFEILDDETREALPDASPFDDILGTSPAMRRIFSLIERVAPHDTTVLLEGETGTGKTLIAEAIHDHSARRDAPFVVLDCSSIPPTLIESELFGHVKGAFTGAHRDHIGVFESADGGTVFLDEIGELPLELQPKLLRALEQRKIKPVGHTAERSLDVRLIAATNRDLRAEMNQGNFRSDLYYRLNTVTLRVPPLRERPEDISQLVSHFYAQFAGADDARPPADLITDFMRRAWPGNVRELRSAVERAVLLGETAPEADGPPPGDTPPPDAAPGTPYRTAKERVVAAFDRRYLSALIARHGGNISSAAREARLDRNYLRDLLRKRDIPVRREP